MQDCSICAGPTPSPSSTMIEFDTVPSNVVVVESMEATFLCVLSPTSEPFTMAWWLTRPGSHRAVLVGTNNGFGARIANHFVRAGERNLALTVQNVQVEQNGDVYTCRVRADNTTILSSAMLEVQCKSFQQYFGGTVFDISNIH